MKLVESIATNTKNESIAEKLIALAKSWSKLKSDQKDLDFRKAQWAREARGCFADDRRFIVWVKNDLGETDKVAQDLCLQARAGGILTDLKVWKEVGGMRAARAIDDLPKKQQIHILEVAKSTERPVSSVRRELHPSEPHKIRDRVENEPIIAQKRTAAQKKEDTDVTILAKFIVENRAKLGKLPASIEVIVGMYAPRGWK